MCRKRRDCYPCEKWLGQLKPMAGDPFQAPMAPTSYILSAALVLNLPIALQVVFWESLLGIPARVRREHKGMNKETASTGAHTWVGKHDSTKKVVPCWLSMTQRVSLDITKIFVKYSVRLMKLYKSTSRSYNAARELLLPRYRFEPACEILL